MEKINLKEKYALFNEHWSPKVIGALNGQQVKIAKVKGAFVWHQHEKEDELFMVIKGKLQLEFRDRIEEINENEIFIVPKGVEHKPVAEEETWIMMFEPATTLNTGNVQSAQTRVELERI